MTNTNAYSGSQKYNFRIATETVPKIPDLTYRQRLLFEKDYYDRSTNFIKLKFEDVMSLLFV